MLIDRISSTLSKRFDIARPPTISAKLFGDHQIAFSRFRNMTSKLGNSAPPDREDAFVFCSALSTVRFSRVSLAGRVQSVTQSTAESYLFDMTARNEISLDATFDNIRIHIPQATLVQMAYEKGIRQVGGFYSRSFGQEDQVLYRLAQTILPAIENSSQVTTAFVEYIGLATFDHLLYTYGGMGRTNRLSGGLSPSQLRRAHDYIEANLAGDPSIADLASECGVSSSFFARSFRATTGMTPHQWIIQRRISRAKSLMRDSDNTLVDIALICGFVDQSHFGRHFRRVVDCTPAEWRRKFRNLRQ